MNVVTLVLNNREVQLDNKPSTQIIDKGEEAAEEDKWKIPAEASKDANDEDKTVHSSVSWKMIRKLWLKKKYAWYWRPTHDEKKMDKNEAAAKHSVLLNSKSSQNRDISFFFTKLQSQII